MALTSEVLRANAALAGLTDEQIAAITTLSANDENSVIAKKRAKFTADWMPIFWRRPVSQRMDPKNV